MTVTLSLVLMLLVTFMTAVIEAARVNTIRFQTECAMDMSMYSALAEYHRELLNQYDLFYIDTSYGMKTAGLEDTQAHLLEAMSYNVTPQKGVTGFAGRDLLAMEAEGAAILSVSTAADENCLGMKSQAVSFMKDKIGIRFAKELLDDVSTVRQKNMTEGIEEKRIETKEIIDGYQGTKVKTGENEWKEVKVDNPVEDIPINDSGFLARVTSGSGGISGKKISKQYYLSQRELNYGNGIAPDRERAEGALDEILFNEYLLEHCGSYTNQLDKSLLNYQIEYILCGKESDNANLEGTLYRILLIREVSNYLYLLSDSGKKSQAALLAAGVSAVTFLPELQPILEQAILLNWAYTESVNDIKILLENGRVPLRKDRDSWHLGITQMLRYKSNLSNGSEEMKGLSYTDYLRILLLLEKPERKIQHFGDIVEMDIRKTPGNQNFRLDVCIDSMEAEMTVRSAFGYRFSIRRRYGYELLE